MLDYNCAAVEEGKVPNTGETIEQVYEANTPTDDLSDDEMNIQKEYQPAAAWAQPKHDNKTEVSQQNNNANNNTIEPPPQQKPAQITNDDNYKNQPSKTMAKSTTHPIPSNNCNSYITILSIVIIIIAFVFYQFTFAEPSVIINSAILHCPNIDNPFEVQTTSKHTIISASNPTHPEKTNYEWIIHQHENECDYSITGEKTEKLAIIFGDCKPFDMKIKLFMNSVENSFMSSVQHNKTCDMYLKYVYPPTKIISNSEILHCPLINNPLEIQLTSGEKTIIASHLDHPSNTKYKWMVTMAQCNYYVIGQNTNELSISSFDECEPFEIHTTLTMNATIRGYIQHIKSCDIHLKFVYPPHQLITDSHMFKCPDIENPLYVSLSTSNETISVQHFDHPTNTIYKWSVKQKEKHCNYRTIGHNTCSLSILGVDASYCDPFKLNITLVMNASSNPYTTHTKTCKMKVIFHDNPVFGIDLGTTYSCISYQKNIQNEYYRRDTHMVVADKKLNQYCVPSAVYCTYDTHGNKQTLVGHDAMHKIKDDPQNVFYDIKRIVGRSPHDNEFKSFKDNHLFKILDDNKRVYIPNWNETLLLEQILSILLTHLVETASKEWYYDNKRNNPLQYVQDVVISAPALFHNGQRKGIRSACHLSGLNPVKLLIEPSAASIAHSYYMTKPDKRTKRFLAFDFGGGTLDCSVMRCAGVECTVLSVHGNNTLGGIDFDNIIRDIVLQKFQQQHGWKHISDTLYSEILQISEQIKIELTDSSDYQLSLKNDKGSVQQITITKDEFEQHPETQALVDSVIHVVSHALELAGHDTQLDSGTTHNVKVWVKMILMIGGTSKIPIVQKTLEEKFGKILVISDHTDAQLMVGKGCGVIGGAIAYKNKLTHLDVVLTDVLPLSIGYQDCVPTEKGELDCKRMRKIIHKNTQYPTKETIQICQKRHNGNKLKLRLFEGDNKHVDNNYYLGEIEINDIQARDVSVCDNVLLSFIVDENGIVHCEAETNPKYGKVKKYRIKIASENSKEGTIKKENVIKLAKAMKSWYNPKSFSLIVKLLKNDPELVTLFENA